jgi:mono/diheme cytochrome c family protein
MLTLKVRGSSRGFLIGDMAAVLFGLAFCLVSFGRAQEKATQEKTVEKTLPPQTERASGKQMYMDYCAPCRGKEGRGDGPTAVALKVPPTDLALLARKNNGKFPWKHVMGVLRFGVHIPAHGTTDMPVWGPVFRSRRAEPIQTGAANDKSDELSEDDAGHVTNLYGLRASLEEEGSALGLLGYVLPRECVEK